MADCLFCRIVQGKAPSKKIIEDEICVAFEDINKMAPFHALVVPREHIETLNDLKPIHEGLVGHLFWVAKKLAADHGIAERGYRTVLNCNPDAGQSVWHIHLHVLGGRRMHWPPG